MPQLWRRWRLLTPLLAPLLCPFALGSACEQRTLTTPAPPAPVESQPIKARPAPIAPVQIAPSAPTPSPPPDWPPGVQPIESPDALEPFYARLARVDAGEPGLKARVIHYGDSHIAADLWTGQLRRRLQERFGDGGHGFLLPGKPWKGYLHQDVRHGVGNARQWDAARVRARAEIDDKLLGLGGYSVRTSQRGASLWASTSNSTPGDAAARFEIFYLEQPGGGTMEIRLDGKRLKRLSTDGPDTIPNYFLHEEPGDAPRHFEVESLGGGELRLFGLVMERARAGVVYDSVGINGARATMPLAWDATLWQQHLARRSPDLMVLTYGTNEVDDRLDLPRYQDKVREVLTLMKEAVPGAACLLVGPPDRAWPVEGDAALGEAATAARMRAEEDPRDRSLWDTPQSLIDIIAAQRGAAKEAGCAFWSTFDAMGGAGSMDIWARSNPALGQRDRIHLTRRGYEKVADNLAEAFFFDYQRRTKKNLGSR